MLHNMCILSATTVTALSRVKTCFFFLYREWGDNRQTMFGDKELQLQLQQAQSNSKSGPKTILVAAKTLNANILYNIFYNNSAMT